MKGMASLGGLVYSTGVGRMCPACRQAAPQCVCKQAQSAPLGDGVVRVSRETKGRGGKAVTLVKGVQVLRGAPVDAAALAELGKQLKALCGAGGTVKDGVIEVQGDHAERVAAALKARGFSVKHAGG
ncbi:MAG: translation initiation factor Sui1 [Burkholderiaceae bacterium]